MDLEKGPPTLSLWGPIHQNGGKAPGKTQEQGTNGFCSDYRKSYREFVPCHKHMRPKGETFTAEGYNSRIGHYPARFRRRDKCYSRQKHTIEKSLKLQMLGLNGESTILT